MPRRSAKTAGFAVLLLVVGRLAGFAHEAGTRHVTCAQHGEQLEAVTLADPVGPSVDSHLVAVGGPSGLHEECEVSAALHQVAHTSEHAWTIGVAVAVAPHVRPPTSVVPLARDLYRIAPKTSPPA